MDVRAAIEHIRLLPETFVDCSLRQGRAAILEQLIERDGQVAESIVDALIKKDIKDTIASLIQKAAPYDIPDDYIFFLEFYGGLAIYDDDHNDWFSVLGVGPMVEEWYGSVDSDEALQEPGEYGFLSLGSRTLGGKTHEFQRVSFFLDLAGTVQKHCVIGVGPWDQSTLAPSSILKDIHAHPHMWHKVANSFTEWLEQAAETRGAFGCA